MKLLHALCLFLMVFWLSAKAEESITLRLKWHHQFQFAGSYMAQHKGFYEKAGLHVIIEEVNPKESYLSFMRKSPSHYAIMDAGGIAQRLKGEPIVTLGAIFQHSPNVLLSLRESELKLVS